MSGREQEGGIMAELKSCPFCGGEAQPILTRRERAIQDAIEKGLNVEAVIKRENAIEQAERERKQQLLEYAC